MANIKFTEMELEGFMSFLNPSVWNWNNPGLNNIIAPNETGKSTLIYALEFCLFGTNSRGGNLDKVPTYEWLRGDNFYGTKVVQTIVKDNDLYKVARHIKYKKETFGVVGGDKLIIEKNGVILDEFLHKKDMQDFIETELLGCKFNVFTSAIIFNQRKVSILQESGQNIREILDNIFETSFLDKAKERASIIEKDLLKRQTNNKLIYEKREIELKYLSQMIETKRTDYNKVISENTLKVKELIVENEKLTEAININSDKLKEIKVEELVDYSKDIKELSDKIKSLEQEKYKLKSEQSILNNSIESLTLNIKACKDKIESHNDLLVSFKNNKFKKTFEIKEEITKIKENTDKLIQEKVANISTICPTCGQVFSEDYYNNIVDNIYKVEVENARGKIDILKEQIKKIELEAPPVIDIDMLNGNIHKYNTEINNKDLLIIDIDKKVTGLDKEIFNNNELLTKLVGQQDVIINKYNIENSKFNKIKEELSKTINNDKSKLLVNENSITLFKSQISNCEKGLIDLFPEEEKVKEIELSFKELTKEKREIEQELDGVSWWNKKGFSNKGIKAFIYNNMLKELNKNIYNYSSKFDSVIRFSVDLEKANTPFIFEIIKQGQKVLYNELSGGAQKRCDIAVAFGMYDLINKNANEFNILILDEFTENLDKKNVELCYELLRSKMKPNRSIYSITHTESDLLQIKKQFLTNINGVSKIL